MKTNLVPRRRFERFPYALYRAHLLTNFLQIRLKHSFLQSLWQVCWLKESNNIYPRTGELPPIIFYFGVPRSCFRNNSSIFSFLFNTVELMFSEIVFQFVNKKMCFGWLRFVDLFRFRIYLVRYHSLIQMFSISDIGWTFVSLMSACDLVVYQALVLLGTSLHTDFTCCHHFSPRRAPRRWLVFQNEGPVEEFSKR